jgi:hypothetical protein
MNLISPTMAALAMAATVNADEPAAIGYGSVAAALQAVRSDPSAQFESQEGWTIVASRENDQAVQWFFTPVGHPSHPAVVKRTALERGGVGFIDLAALCEVPQSECDQLLDDFRQQHEQATRSVLAEQVLLDVGIALNDHDRLRVSRMLTEEGKAAEIRMDDVLKLVIVPTLDALGGVMLWAAMYEFDGSDYVLVSEPSLTTPGEGTAQIQVSSESGNTFGFSITPLLASR